MATKKEETTKKKTTTKTNTKKTSSTTKPTTKKTTTKKEIPEKTTKKDEVKTKKKTTTPSKKTTTKKETTKKVETKKEEPKEVASAKPKTTAKKKTTSTKKNTKVENKTSEEKTPAKKTTSTKKKTTTKTQEKEVKPKTTKKTTSSKKTTTTTKTTKKETPKKTTKPKITEVSTDTQVLNVINDDELHTQISLPIITEEIAKKEETPKKTDNKLKDYDIKKKKENKLKTYINNMCKVLLSFGESLKNFIKEKYNSNRQRKESKKILKERFKKEKQILKELKQQEKKTDQREIVKEFKPLSEIKDKKERKKTKKAYANGYNDELVLLRYRDFKGLRKISVFFINRIRVIAYDMRRFKKKFKYGTFKDKLLIILMLLLIIGFIAVIAFCAYIVINAPEISEAKLYKTNATVLYDKDGVEFARLGTENREKVSYEQLPEVLVDAIVATEDSRYFQHNGMDIARFTKAAIGQVLGHDDAGGGSTLTMQVSKNAATSTVASGIQGIIRKFTDVYLAVFVFEQKYTKEQIIEFYVNIPYLGSGSYGVEQASQTYFGKSVSELTLPEAALIAGLFQAPDAYDPYNHPELAEQRRNTVLNLMYRHGYITEEQRDNAKTVPVESQLVGRNARLSPYISFIDTVVEEVIDRTKTEMNPKGDDPYNVSMKIYTTLDRSRQDVVNDVSNGVSYTFKNDVAQTAIAVISAEDGSIVAIGGGRNKTTERSLNYATSNRTHPGSTAKPVLDYGPAIEYLNWSTGQTILDEKYTYTGGGSIRNWDSDHKGVMTIKKALAQSRNIPALFAFQQTTHEQKLTFAEDLGWTVETDGNGHILESCAIGGFDGVTVLEAAAAYATFARGGTYIEPYSFTKLEYTESGDTLEVQPKKVQAMSEETAYMINMILKYAVTSGQIGAGSVSGTDIAAKTGTSTVGDGIKKQLGIKGSIIGDSWEVAYSPDYAIATWYGYPKITKEYYLTNKEGGDARKKITKTLVKGIMKKNSRFKKPSGVVSGVEIEIGTDPLQLASEFTPKELRSKEYFKKGTVPTTTSTRFSQLENPTNVRYTATDSSVTLTWNPIAIPDAINEEYLRQYFENSNAYKNWVDKSLEDRLAYNKKNIGTIGYQIYMTNASGTTNLGFVTSNTFTANVVFDSETTFTVKSSYSIFKDNQSKGVSVVVEPNGSSPTPEPGTEVTTKPSTSSTTKPTFSISYVGGTCNTVNDFNQLGNSGKDKIKVTSNGSTVTDEATINYVCYPYGSETSINCSEMTNGKKYEVLFTVVYKGQSRSKSVTLNSSCN